MSGGCFDACRTCGSAVGAGLGGSGGEQPPEAESTNTTRLRRLPPPLPLLPHRLTHRKRLQLLLCLVPSRCRLCRSCGRPSTRIYVGFGCSFLFTACLLFLDCTFSMSHLSNPLTVHDQCAPNRHKWGNYQSNWSGLGQNGQKTSSSESSSNNSDPPIRSRLHSS